MKTKFIGGAVLALATLLTGYAVASEMDAGAAPAMPGGRGMMESMCPMKVQGAAVEAKEMDGAAAFAFTTKGGNVDDLRQRVRHMAQMHANAGGMMTTITVSGRHRAPRDLKVRREPLPPSVASAEDVAHGALLILRPKDLTQLAALRRQVRILATSMDHLHGECPEMGEAVAPAAAGTVEGQAEDPAPLGK